MPVNASFGNDVQQRHAEFESPILRGMKKPPVKGVFSFPDSGGFVFEPGFWAHGDCEAVASRRGPPFSAITQGAPFLERLVY